MNDLILRQRHKNLLIVEGENEENKLFQIIFGAFPELDITIDDIIIYGTNIYVLYKDIINAYGINWFDEDVDLPFIVGKKKNYQVTLNKKDFINIYLVFDYEHHDPIFSEEHIKHMQRYFCDSTEMGKLYLNYPMIESYKHFNCIPDAGYENLTAKVTLQPGFQYKNLVRNLYVDKLVNIPTKIEVSLKNCYGINEIEECKIYAKQLLDITDQKHLQKKIHTIFFNILSLSDLIKAENHFSKLLLNTEHITNNMSYYDYMRNILRQIVIHNIVKGNKIQSTYLDTKNYKNLYELLDLNEILKEQNNVSRDEVLGYIWVLNTCVFIIPDYNFKLIQS